MAKGPLVQIGWVVRAKVRGPDGRIVDRAISRNFTSESVAEAFKKVAAKDPDYKDAFVAKNYG